MNDEPFTQLDEALAQGGVAGLAERLLEQMRGGPPGHELFDALLFAARYRLGLDVAASTPLETLPEPLRGELERAYLAACREVGGRLLDAGRFREAWMYLRPTGEPEPLARALAATAVTPENAQELVELALHEGVAPELGFRVVLEHYGTCNAITTYEGLFSGRPPAQQQGAAGLLVDQVADELRANVAADVARREGRPPSGSLRELIAGRDWLWEGQNYHVDTTHLHATVRFARVCTAPAVIERAWELTEYGRRLDQQFQFAGDEPFVDFYASSGLYFAAQLGRQVPEALDHFRVRAEQVNLAEQGPAAAEIYVALLARLARWEEAAAAAARLLPPGARTSGLAPPLVELARRAGSLAAPRQLARQSGDLVGYAVALAVGARLAP